jgi:hypothetical protein
MRFNNVLVGIFDGHVDGQGEIVEPNYHLPRLTVPVTTEFYADQTVGIASNITLANNRLYATLDLDNNYISMETLRQFSASIGGVVNHREGNRVTEWTLTDIALVRNPADPRIPRIVSDDTYYEVDATTIRLDHPIDTNDALSVFHNFFEEEKPLKKEKAKKRPRYADWEFALET